MDPNDLDGADVQLSLLPQEGIDWSRARPPKRVWLEETRGDHAARLEFLASQGLRLIMASPGPSEGGTLHFYNPRDRETLHLRAEGGRDLLPAASAFFPAASRWMEMSRGRDREPPRDAEASAWLVWGGCLVAVEAGRVVRVEEASAECPGAPLRGTRAAQACAALEKGGGGEGVARAVSFARACEEARGIKTPPAAEAVRALLLESSRARSHLAWLERAALCLGRRRAAAACRELRAGLEEAFTSWLGDPLGRGWVTPGGVSEEFPLEDAGGAAAALASISASWRSMLERGLSLHAPRWMERRLSALRERKEREAWTGPLARALGVGTDARAEEPGVYALLDWEMVPEGVGGGVFQKLAAVKAREVSESLRVARRVLECPPARPLMARRGRGGRGEGFGRCEGPEGELCCHLAVEKGTVTFLALSLPGEINRSGALVLEGRPLDEADLLFLPWNEIPSP